MTRALDIDGKAPPAEDCECCSRDLDLSLPDMDAHWYLCAGCEAVICFDCRSMDTTGEDWCSDCSDSHERENPSAFSH